ncbi:hypothetical protein [Rathayibacter sp. AY1D9]|uniref:hypothetical protein n=1 Tax=Rathayibacter sp. AY1D9 TaxID=2080548 RepID=UPI000CE8BD37|nr:hypothetical protein [Rathayibacter sp. AY1D9]PPH83906.1 hypothetical protein C5C50_04195 [Rathayibacter sp. AY1D9]
MKLSASAYTVLILSLVSAALTGCAADDQGSTETTYSGPSQLDEPYTPPTASSNLSVDPYAFQPSQSTPECDLAFYNVTDKVYGSADADSALVGTAFACESLDDWATSARSNSEAYGVNEEAMDDEFLTWAVVALCEPSDSAPAVRTLKVCAQALEKGIIRG